MNSNSRRSQKQAGVAILISGKVELRTKQVQKEMELTTY
jgi:hypothetical protein